MNLAKSALAYCAVEVKVIEADLTVEVDWFREAASHLALMRKGNLGKWIQELYRDPEGKVQGESNSVCELSKMEITEFFICFRSKPHSVPL